MRFLCANGPGYSARRARALHLPALSRLSTNTSSRAASTITSGIDQQMFARYTLDDADQFLPTDYPQFPRDFLSRNQFATVEHPQVISPHDAEHGARRLQPDAHRAERSGELRPTLAPSSPART